MQFKGTFCIIYFSNILFVYTYSSFVKHITSYIHILKKMQKHLEICQTVKSPEALNKALGGRSLLHCLEQHLDRNVANPKVRLEYLGRTSQGDFSTKIFWWNFCFPALKSWWFIVIHGANDARFFVLVLLFWGGVSLVWKIFIPEFVMTHMWSW